MFDYYFNIPILTYHKISEDKEYGLTTVAPKQFEEQIAHLHSEGYQTITPKDYLNINPSEKNIIISFDDGYESVYKNALPIMNKYNFKGVVFIISNYINKLNTWDANLGSRCFKHMNTDQINQLIHSSWEIGAHSLTHKTFIGNKNIRSEILDSVRALESEFGISVKLFSYPFGSSPKAAKKIVRENDLFAFKATPGTASKELIPRCSVYSTDTIKNINDKINLRFKELIKLKLINLGAKVTEIGQILNIIRR